MQYVCADIHGRYDRYEKLLQTIQLQDTDTLYVLGDMIDRGPDGIQVVLDMMGRKNVVPFLGNHEHLMLLSLEERAQYEAALAQAKSQAEDMSDRRYIPVWTDEYYARNWLEYHNGGDVTYAQLKALPKRKQKQLLAYLRSAWVQKLVREGEKTYVLCHGSFYGAWTAQEVYYEERGSKPIERPEDMADVVYDQDTMGLCAGNESKAFRALWYNPYRYYSDERVPASAFALYPQYTFVNGHVPVQTIDDRKGDSLEPYFDGNEIDIDGGCALSQRPEYQGETDTCLFCLRLGDEKVYKIY